MKQYDYEKNNDIDLEKLTIGTHKKVWWVCSKGHSYEQEIRSKVKAIGCPICNNKKVLQGYNDLATTNPEILNMWDKSKNDNVQPSDFSKGSDFMAWWICPVCNNSWQQRISHITKGIGCPQCHYNPYKK